MPGAQDYLRLGWPLIALHGATAGGGCTCKRADCRSAGKHPRTDLCPRGVTDATLDSEVVGSWGDEVNLGVALGKAAGGMMVIDIDDEEALRALHGHPCDLLTSRTGGGGLHMWFRSTGETRTFLLKAGGRHVGEVRGDGAYVVVPPSTTPAGQYTWYKRSPIAETDDPRQFVQAILAVHGIELDISEDTMIMVDEWEALTPADPPPELIQGRKLGLLKKALAGRVGSNIEDRSGKLYRIACELYEEAAKLGASIDPKSVARILKKADLNGFHKYIYRHDADRYYWTIAIKAEADNLSGNLRKDEEEQNVDFSVGNRLDYLWDPNDECTYYQPSSKVSKKISNFLSKIVEDVTTDFGATAKNTAHRQERWWRLLIHKPGNPDIEISVPHQDKRDLATLTIDLIRRGCPATYWIAAGMERHLFTAIQVLSDHIEVRTTLGSMGWHTLNEKQYYILPSAEGAITAEGMDPSVKIDPTFLPPNTPLTTNLSGYGRNLRVPGTEEEYARAWSAFESLLQCGPIGITLTVAAQVLAGPLYRAGFHASPPLLHVMGDTGTLKTSFCQLALSLFGFHINKQKTPMPASYVSTVSSVELLLHTSRDATLLIDDYKVLHPHIDDFKRLINSYADGAYRQRMSNNQELREGVSPSGLILSTGEDCWDQAASAQARTMILHLKKFSDAPHLALDPHKLDLVESAVVSGDLQLFGGRWLSWLARQSFMQFDGLSSLLRTTRDQVYSWGEENLHPRLYGSVAATLTCQAIISRFIQECWPEHLAKFTGWCSGARTFLLAQMKEVGDEVEQARPLNLLLDALTTGMKQNEVHLKPVWEDGAETCIPNTVYNTKVVGLYERQTAYLSRGMTYLWYKEREGRARETVPFSWNNIAKEIRGRFPTYQPAHGGLLYGHDASGNPTQHRVVAIPLSLLQGALPASDDKAESSSGISI